MSRLATMEITHALKKDIGISGFAPESRPYQDRVLAHYTIRLTKHLCKVRLKTTLPRHHQSQSTHPSSNQHTRHQSRCAKRKPRYDDNFLP